MLLSLTLINFVIVKEININFNKGFTVFTGETGAGKSIILDAISILLGAKANLALIRKGNNIAQISSLFNIGNLQELKNLLLNQNLLNNDSDELVLRRVIDINGKSKSFINGILVPVSQLKQIGKYLIDIHGQHNHFSLNLSSTQKNILDLYSDSLQTVQNVKKIFLAWEKAKKELSQVIENNESLKIIYEKLLHQQQEITAINLKENEWEHISNKYKILSKSSEILSVANKIQDNIDNNPDLITQIIKLNKQLSEFAELDPLFDNSIDILNSIATELSEVSSNMRTILSKIDVNPQELEYYDNRIKEILSLSKKYNISPTNIKDKLAEIEHQLHNLNSKLNIKILEEKVFKLEQQYFHQSNKLTNLRKKGATQLTKNINIIIKQLALPNAFFAIELINTKPSLFGNESVEFKIAVNKADDLHALSKVVSGGELSRISLAISIAINDYIAIPTLIFDEIDAGIGGKTATIVGEYLKKLADKLQVIVVTHLPQIASKGDDHFLVQKNDHKNNTTTYVQLLDKEQRIAEISRMLGATEITPAVRAHAQHLLNNDFSSYI